MTAQWTEGDWDEFFRLARLALRVGIKEPEFDNHHARFERHRDFGWFALKETFWCWPRPDQQGELTIRWLDYNPGDPESDAARHQKLHQALEVLRKHLVLECLSDV